jgi:polysaccharide deacetylase 2 family uncharacterized protein YibQ
MSRKLVIAIIIAAVMLTLAVIKSRPVDIIENVSAAEKAVLAVLRSHGGAGGEILFRGEDVWKKGRVSGKTVNYIIRLDNPVSVAELTEQLKAGLKDLGGVSLSKAQHRGEYEDSAYFEIECRGSVVLTLTLENIIPGRVRVQEEAKKEKALPAIALVLDDFGYTRKNLETLKNLDAPITIAVLPDAPYSGAVSYYAAKNGIEVILHLPMEPETEGVKLEKNTITGDMDKDVIKKILDRDLETVSFAKGVSNHQGSRATKNESVMTAILGELKERGLFFFDSMTTGRSVCGDVAKREGVPYFRRDIFIDKKADEEYIKGQLAKTEEIARRRGYAAAIGHERPETIRVLQEAIPEMEKRGIEFVYLSEIVKKVNGERL